MMDPITPAHLLARLRWRYAVKQFDAGRRVDDEAWAALEQALVLSPSSFNLQPWRFLVVADAAVRRELRAASWNQAQITDADRLVVFLGRRDLTTGDVERLMARTSEVCCAPLASLDGYRRMLGGVLAQGLPGITAAEWNARQVYLALGQFMTAAAMLGIDTSALEGIDAKAYDRILDLDGTAHRTLVVCTAGHRAPADATASRPKVRYAADEVVGRR